MVNTNICLLRGSSFVMERVKKLVYSLMFNAYVHEGKVLSFQEVQNILISIGFSYYINPYDGKKKLRIRKYIIGDYKSIKKKLPRLKKQRDLAFNYLKSVIEAVESGEIDRKHAREVLSKLKDYLTSRDRDYFSQVLKQKTSASNEKGDSKNKESTKKVQF